MLLLYYNCRDGILNQKVCLYQRETYYNIQPVAFKTWWGHQYIVGIICPPPVGIGLRWLPKPLVDTSPRPHAHRRAWTPAGSRQGSKAKPQQPKLFFLQHLARVTILSNNYFELLLLILWRKMGKIDFHNPLVYIPKLIFQ